MRRSRKQTEPTPPGEYIRSRSGRPARLVRTRHINAEDQWLYRLDYGPVVGTQTWSISDMEDQGFTFSNVRPNDLPDKLEEA